MATLSVPEHGPVCLDDGETRRDLPKSALSWSSRIGSTSRRATLPDGSVFETSDNDQVDRLVRSRGGAFVIPPSRLERLRPALLSLVVVATLAFFISLRWTLPWLGDTAAAFLPQAVEAHIGVNTLKTLDRIAFHPSELPAPTRHAVLAVFDKLKTHANAPENLSLAFRRGGSLVGANALALPGGHVIITDELVALAESPEALAGVLAHEIGHVEHRHGVRQLGRVMGLSAVVLLMTGDASSMANDVGVFGAGLLELSFSRGFEREADTRGVVLMRQAGKDPESLAVLLERLQGLTEAGDIIPAWLSSHPSTPERVQRIRQQAAEQNVDPRPR